MIPERGDAEGANRARKEEGCADLADRKESKKEGLSALKGDAAQQAPAAKADQKKSTQTLRCVSEAREKSLRKKGGKRRTLHNCSKRTKNKKDRLRRPELLEEENPEERNLSERENRGLGRQASRAPPPSSPDHKGRSRGKRDF